MISNWQALKMHICYLSTRRRSKNCLGSVMGLVHAEQECAA